jgi:hypothetical protein
MLHHDVLVFRKNLGEAIGTRQQVDRFVARPSARGPEIRHAPDVGQSNSARDFTVAIPEPDPAKLARLADLIENWSEPLTFTGTATSSDTPCAIAALMLSNSSPLSGVPDAPSMSICSFRSFALASQIPCRMT